MKIELNEIFISAWKRKYLLHIYYDIYLKLKSLNYLNFLIKFSFKKLFKISNYILLDLNI